METCESTLKPLNSVTDGPTVDSENDDQNNESKESFQKFMYKLFEKNGILNDLRAYLRGHIVNILRSAQTGDVPSCQKHFTQRLEYPSQALNMLVAEYLLRMEFNYSLSVFVSEIPLTNMVFEFARSLIENGEQTEGLSFTQKDVWSIINYLGVKCDSDYATKIVDMYRSENMSLLQCLLKCTPIYRKEPDSINHESSNDSLSSISLDYLDDKVRNLSKNKDKCKHMASCKICRSRFSRIREGYKEKKHFLAKTVKETNLNSLNLENIMQNITDMERNLIDEMFEQLKSVYETEVDMMKAEEDKKVKRSLASHSLQLQQQRDEMEESFKVREEELERNLQNKKKFLWGLAKALREQHAQISRAQLVVRDEARRLSAKEDNLKSQLIDAEKLLIKRAEEMRYQISNELYILEGHLESMKRERENISRERCQLEQLKTVNDINSNVIKIDNLEENTDPRTYDFLKNEFNILKKYLKTTKVAPKCFVERSTLTDLNDVSSKLSLVLNNEQDSDRNYSREEERGVRTPNQVVNDFKKQKNVNFSQSNLDEIYRERSRDRSKSSASSDAGDAAARDSFERDRDRERDRETIRRLRDENERLKALARQQREHIEDVWTQPAPTPAPRVGQPRAHTAPDLFYIHNSSPTRTVAPNTFGWRKGAGEELSMFSNVQPRIVLPGDPVPFIGVMRDRHADNRRHLISQWRALRRRMSPVGMGRLRTCTAASAARDRIQRPSSAGPSVNLTPAPRAQDAEHDKQPFVTVFQPIPFDNTFQPSTCNNIEVEERPRTSVCMDTRKMREKSPKSLLREAKEKLRNNIPKNDPQPARGRDKSPNAVLREAKLRLRKLEIEAEAVEKSYRDFRRRQSEMRSHSYSPANEEAIVTKDVGNLDLKRSASLHRDFNEKSNSNHKEHVKSKTDLQTYIREYQSAFQTHFINRNTVDKKAKPIPEQFSPQITQTKEDLKSKLNNFLETPLTEFRKFYQSQIPQRPLRIDDAQKGPANHLSKNSDGDNVKENSIKREATESDAIKAKNSKEFEILKRNLNKIYNLQDEPTEIPQLSNEENITPDAELIQESEKNLLQIEVESVSEIQRMTTESEPQNILLVVETSVIENEEQLEDDENIMSANITILISPRRSDPDIDERAKSPDKGKRSISPEQAARLTRNDVLDAIFHADTTKEASSIEMQLEISKEKEDSISEVERPPDDYPDDFSADVDNYNSRSEYENQSPISIPKDDPFWDT